MSKKYGIYCENCNKLLNNENDNIFGSNFGHLYHSNCIGGGINNGKSTDGQTLMLFKMNLKFADTPTLTTEAEGEIMELRQSIQQREAKIKALQHALIVKNRLKDDINKLMDCVEKLENTSSINVLDKSTDIVNNTSQKKSSNKRANDVSNLNKDDSSLTVEPKRQNIERNNSNNGMLQSVQQLEARIKTLEDALQHAKSNGNKLTDCVERVEKSKAIVKSPDGGNNITQDNSIEKLKQTSSDCHSNQQSYGCKIFNFKRNTAYSNGNFIQLAQKIGLSLTHDQINNIDIYEDNVNSDFRNLYVQFCNKDLRDEFLKKSHILKEFPETKNLLCISNETEYHTVVIRNVENYSSPIDDVIAIAKKMFLWLTRDQIMHVDAFKRTRVNKNVYYGVNNSLNGLNYGERHYYIYCVYFSTKHIKDTFLEKSHILKENELEKHLQFY